MNGRANGPVLTSLFLFVPDHRVVVVGEVTNETQGVIMVVVLVQEEQ